MGVAILLAFILIIALIAKHIKEQKNKGEGSTGVQVPVRRLQKVALPGLSFKTTDVPTSIKEKEKMSSNYDTIQFTVDLETFVRVALNDPKCTEEVYAAIRKGPIEHTAICGAANLGIEGGENEWFTLFMGTDRRVQAGTPGFVFRNQRGDRISARLRRQLPKNQEAQTPGQVLPQQEQGNMELLSRAIGGDQVAAQSLLDFAAQQAVPSEALQEDTAPTVEVPPAAIGELPEL